MPSYLREFTIRPFGLIGSKHVVDRRTLFLHRSGYVSSIASVFLSNVAINSREWRIIAVVLLLIFVFVTAYLSCLVTRRCRKLR
jgi:glucan phosphoethanolaminetransferase (alkaline phosphatase superfamily)